MAVISDVAVPQAGINHTRFEKRSTIGATSYPHSLVEIPCALVAWVF
jgi:hypothetical protein